MQYIFKHKACFSFFIYILYRHHHHHYRKHQGLDPLIRSVSRVTTALANVSSVSQLFSFLVVCSDMISKGFGLVAFFATVNKIHSIYILYVLFIFFYCCMAG
jgi:hypothetical protein